MVQIRVVSCLLKNLYSVFLAGGKLNSKVAASTHWSWSCPSPPHGPRGTAAGWLAGQECCRPIPNGVAAEVLFLRKQLAYDHDHHVRPRRLTDGTRVAFLRLERSARRGDAWELGPLLLTGSAGLVYPIPLAGFDSDKHRSRLCASEFLGDLECFIERQEKQPLTVHTGIE